MIQQDEAQTPMPVKRVATIGGLIAAVIVVSLIAIAFGAGKPSIDTPKGRMQISTVQAIQAQINLNYVTEGSYAFSYENLIDEAKDEDKMLLKEYQESLPNFDYSVRGDGGAYRIIYTNVAGDEVVVDGEYKNEYH